MLNSTKINLTFINWIIITCIFFALDFGFWAFIRTRNYKKHPPDNTALMIIHIVICIFVIIRTL